MTKIEKQVEHILDGESDEKYRFERADPNGMLSDQLYDAMHTYLGRFEGKTATLFAFYMEMVPGFLDYQDSNKSVPLGGKVQPLMDIERASDGGCIVFCTLTKDPGEKITLGRLEKMVSAD